MKITFSFEDNEGLQDIAARLHKAADLFSPSSAVLTEEPIVKLPPVAKEAETAPPKKKVKPTKALALKSEPFDEDSNQPVELESDDDVGDFATSVVETKKAVRAKKLTVEDVNDACKARARAGGKEGRAQVLEILKKQFKTQSVSDLEETQYAAVIEAMTAYGIMGDL